MRNVLIVTYYWPPSGGPGVQRVLKFCKYLPEFGWNPIVLTVKDGDYPVIDHSLLKDTPRGIPVLQTTFLSPVGVYKQFVGMDRSERIPVAVLTQKRRGLRKRISYWIRCNLFIPDAKIGWLPVAFRYGKKLINDYHPEIIFSTSPPPTVHIIAGLLAGWSRTKWVADFRDPWTNIYHYDQAPKTRLAAYLDQKLEQQVTARADKITVVSNGFFDNIDEDRLQQIPNGFDSGDVVFVREKMKNKKFTICYMGSMKTRQYIDAFFTALEHLSQNELFRKSMCFEMIGIVDPDVIRTIQAKNIGIEIKFTGYLDHDQALARVMRADLLVFIIGKSSKSKLIVTGKLFEYFMVRKPILAIGPLEGAAHQMIRETGTGEMFTYDDQSAMEKYIVKHYRRWESGTESESIDMNKLKKYDRKNLTRRLARVFEEIV